MSTFDSLNFNINVSDNASVVLNNVERTLGRVTAQTLSLEKSQLSLNNANITATQGQISYDNAVRRQTIAKLNLEIVNRNLAREELNLTSLQSTEGVTANQIANAQNRVALAKIAVEKANISLANSSAMVNSAQLTQQKQANSVVIAQKNLELQMLRTSKTAKTSSSVIVSFFSKLFTTAIIARYIGGFLADIVEETGSYVENLNLFSVAFGETYQETVDWALDLAEGFGLASNEVIKFAGTFRQLATSMGLVEDTADSITKTIIELGYDISALYNIGVEEAMEKLQSGLYSGYTRPMRSLGIDVSQNQVDALFETNEALKGLNVSAMNLKQGDKVLARLLITMQAASNSFGTMNREINTLQSQIRILQGSFDNFKLALGDLVQEPVRQTLVYINALIIGITDVIRAFKPIQTIDANAVAFSNLGEEVDEATQSLDQLEGKLAKFDKFNVLGQGSQSQNGELAVTEALTAELKKQQQLYEERKKMFESVTNEATNAAKAIKDWFVFDTGNKDKEGNPIFAWTKQAKSLATALLALTSIGIVKWAKGAMLAFSSLKAGQAVTGIAKIGSLLTKIFTPLGGMIVAIAAAIIYMYKNNENFRNSVNRLFTALMSLVGSVLTPLLKLLETLTKVLTPILNIMAECLAWVVNIVAGVVEFLEMTGLLEGAVWGIVLALIAWKAVQLYSWITTNAFAIKAFIKLLLPTAITAVKSLAKVIINDLVYGFQVLVGWLNTTKGTLAVTFLGIGVLAVGISNFISNFDKLSDNAKVWIPILAGLAGAITAVAAALTFMKGNWIGAISLGAIVSGIGLSVGTALSTSAHANGGYTNANLIMTHENGKREWVGKAAGSSAIVNDTQMSDIMEMAVAKGVYQALNARSAMGGDTSSNETIVVKIGEEAVFNAVRKTARKQGRDIPTI